MPPLTAIRSPLLCCCVDDLHWHATKCPTMTSHAGQIFHRYSGQWRCIACFSLSRRRAFVILEPATRSILSDVLAFRGNLCRAAEPRRLQMFLTDREFHCFVGIFLSYSFVFQTRFSQLLNSPLIGHR